MTSESGKIWFGKPISAVSICVYAKSRSVTGASSGLGRAVVEHTLARGERVVATLRKPQALDDLVSKYPATQLLVLSLDVISPSAITSAFDAAIAKFGRIDIVYNNAGFGGSGRGRGHAYRCRAFRLRSQFLGSDECLARSGARVSAMSTYRVAGGYCKYLASSACMLRRGMGFYSST